MEARLTAKLRSRKLYRDYLKRRNLSLADLADLAGLAKATVGHFSSGHRTNCSAATATAIEEALDVPPGTLFLDQVVHGANPVPQYARTSAA